jgi:hypothetical protein
VASSAANVTEEFVYSPRLTIRNDEYFRAAFSSLGGASQKLIREVLERRAVQRQHNEVRHHAAIGRIHARTVSVENPRDLNSTP